MTIGRSQQTILARPGVHLDFQETRSNAPVHRPSDGSRMDASAGLPAGPLVGLHKVGERNLSLRILSRRDDAVPDLEPGRIHLQNIGCALQNIFAKFIRSDIESAAL